MTSTAVLLAAVGLVSFLLALAALRPGHYWGDDFALYIRQGEGLIHFDTARVIRDIHFTVKWSKVKGFTPDVYPWGTALLLAVPLSLFGRDIMAMKVTMAIAFAVGAAAWFALARRRLPLAAALGVAACCVLCLPVLRWVDAVGSDIPYLAMAGLCLAVLARWLDRGPITTRQAIALGALGAAAFTFRNEGLGITAALLAGIALSHLFTATRMTWRPVVRVAVIRTAIAGAVALAITLVLRLLLPYDMLPSYKDAGPERITKNWSTYIKTVTGQFGFYDNSRRRFAALDHPALGTALLYLFLVLLAVGLVRMLIRHDVIDIVLLLTALIHAYTALTFITPAGRYLFVTVAVMFIVIAQGAATVATGVARLLRTDRRRYGRALAPAVTFVLLAAFPIVQISPYRTMIHAAGAARDADRPQVGPYQPLSLQMFAAVRKYTTADDVILALKPRAMTLYTDRSAVKIKAGATPPEVATYMAVEEAAGGELKDVPDGATEVWSNAIWHLLKLPRPAAGGTG